MGTIRCLETSASGYSVKLCLFPDEWNPQLHHGEKLKLETRKRRSANPLKCEAHLNGIPDSVPTETKHCLIYPCKIPVIQCCVHKYSTEVNVAVPVLCPPLAIRTFLFFFFFFLCFCGLLGMGRQTCVSFALHCCCVCQVYVEA